MTYTNKTQATTIEPASYLEKNFKGSERIQKEAHVLIDLYTKITGSPCVMWNRIFGFGKYYYKDSRGGEHNYSMTGFAIAKTGFTLYNLMGWETYKKDIEKLGTYKLTGVTGKCTIFSCSDGINTNTCDLTCKEVPPKSSGAQVIKPSNTQKVVISTDTAVVTEGTPKILKVTPDAAYVGSTAPIGVDFFPGANFKGYDAAIIGDVVVDFYIGDTDYKNPDGSIHGTFWVPAGILAGPSSLILMNKKDPKSALTWSEKFIVTPGGDAQSIVSVTPSHGKAGDTIVVKIAMGKKAYTKRGFVAFNGQNNEFVSSTFESRAKNGGVYTMTYKLLPGNASGFVKLVSAGEFPEVVSDTYFTVDKPGVITSFFNYLGSWFK